jgi:hypothetical protein
MDQGGGQRSARAARLRARSGSFLRWLASLLGCDLPGTLGRSVRSSAGVRLPRSGLPTSIRSGGMMPQVGSASINPQRLPPFDIARSPRARGRPHWRVTALTAFVAEGYACSCEMSDTSPAKWPRPLPGLSLRATALQSRVGWQSLPQCSGHGERSADGAYSDR